MTRKAPSCSETPRPGPGRPCGRAPRAVCAAGEGGPGTCRAPQATSRHAVPGWDPPDKVGHTPSPALKLTFKNPLDTSPQLQGLGWKDFLFLHLAGGECPCWGPQETRWQLPSQETRLQVTVWTAQCPPRPGPVWSGGVPLVQGLGLRRPASTREQPRTRPPCPSPVGGPVVTPTRSSPGSDPGRADDGTRVCGREGRDASLGWSKNNL